MDEMELNMYEVIKGKRKQRLDRFRMEYLEIYTIRVSGKEDLVDDIEKFEGFGGDEGEREGMGVIGVGGVVVMLMMMLMSLRRGRGEKRENQGSLRETETETERESLRKE